MCVRVNSGSFTVHCVTSTLHVCVTEAPALQTYEVTQHSECVFPSLSFPLFLFVVASPLVLHFLLYSTARRGIVLCAADCLLHAEGEIFCWKWRHKASSLRQSLSSVICKK